MHPGFCCDVGLISCSDKIKAPELGSKGSVAQGPDDQDGVPDRQAKYNYEAEEIQVSC